MFRCVTFANYQPGHWRCIMIVLERLILCCGIFPHPKLFAAVERAARAFIPVTFKIFRIFLLYRLTFLCTKYPVRETRPSKQCKSLIDVLILSNIWRGQGCMFRLTCSYPELTEDHVLTSAYVKIFRTVTRNAVNKSV